MWTDRTVENTKMVRTDRAEQYTQRKERNHSKNMRTHRRREQIEHYRKGEYSADTTRVYIYRTVEH